MLDPDAPPPKLATSVGALIFLTAAFLGLLALFGHLNAQRQSAEAVESSQ
jgi:hypothetical protein